MSHADITVQLLRIPLPGPLFLGVSMDVLEIAMTMNKTSRNDKTNTNSSRGPDGINPGILEKLKHEISELQTQWCVTSQLKLGSRGLRAGKGDRLLRDRGQDIKPEICAISSN